MTHEEAEAADRAADEAAVARFPNAMAFMEVPDERAPLGAWGVVINRDGTAWIFDGGEVSPRPTSTPRPIDSAELKARGAFPTKPSDVAELVPTDAPAWPDRHVA
jgi:hypothetical protein